jgi:hypothetical protein
MSNKITQYNYDPKLQNALQNFINTIDNIYKTLDLKLTNNEKIKIQEIIKRRKQNEPG